MVMAAKGLAKLAEELCELGVVVGKKLAYYHTDVHPDGSGSLLDRLHDEAGDVLAAIDFVAHKWGLDVERIQQRRLQKLDTFRSWDSDPDNNVDAVDSRASVKLEAVADGDKVRRCDDGRIAVVGGSRCTGAATGDARQVWCDHEALWWSIDTRVERV